ncbi:MAG: aminoglycoside phosphotransferase [Spirochaetaceae bacterium]|nr:aminoglycoside phosphotransferase [Spirochaetaceae bacterium]|tara:strand:- start:10320 stop:10793 length:474 start_codon:yes stop_codon:yes gene_type:complete
MELEYLESIIPREHFNIKTDGTAVENAQAMINQCHPGHTHMQLQTLGGEEAEAQMPLVQDTRALHGLMHGGVYFTVGDTITALMCAYHLEGPRQRMLTGSGSIRYLRPVESGVVKARARLKKKQKNQLFFICDFLNEQGKRVAQAKYNYFLIELPSN